jgi:hypothetical protein
VRRLLQSALDSKRRELLRLAKGVGLLRYQPGGLVDVRGTGLQRRRGGDDG